MFQNETSFPLSCKAGIKGYNSELCLTSKGISCGSILLRSKMDDSCEDLFGARILLVLGDCSNFSLFLNNRYLYFPISCALIADKR